MGEKYIMFVDERGFLSTSTNDNFLMTGVIFQYDYCIDLKNKKCELKTKLNEYKAQIFSNSKINISLDDIINKEKFLKKADKNQIKKLINEVPLLIETLEVTIISSKTKQEINNEKDSYSIAIKSLLKGFYSFIMAKDGECGAIIMEARACNSGFIRQQSFFNEYNERNISLSMLENIQDKINTFIVCEKNDKKYSLGIEVSNILNNILFEVSNGIREIDNKLMSYTEYSNRDKILNAIKHKFYKDTPVEISNIDLENIFSSSMGILSKELKILKEQLNLKDTKINEKEKEINELTDEIQLLKQQLQEYFFSRKNDTIMFQILSDIDFKMKEARDKSIFV